MKKILIIGLLGLLACKAESPKNISSSPAQASATAAQVPPAIPAEKLIDLYESCDYIDIIFRDLPFSISQEDKPSIQQTIRNINNVAPTSINTSCTYFAQQIFQEDGEIVLDAKIFFQETCTYYLFYENGVEKYSGSFTPDGIKFYNNILAQAEKARTNG